MNVLKRHGIHLNFNLFDQGHSGQCGSLRLDKIHAYDAFDCIAVFRCLPTWSSTRFAALVWTAI